MAPTITKPSKPSPNVEHPSPNVEHTKPYVVGQRPKPLATKPNISNILPNVECALILEAHRAQNAKYQRTWRAKHSAYVRGLEVKVLQLEHDKVQLNQRWYTTLGWCFVLATTLVLMLWG
jgi:hypothetical protein